MIETSLDPALAIDRLGGDGPNALRPSQRRTLRDIALALLREPTGGQLLAPGRPAVINVNRFA